jgi:hypothetical protein
MVSKKESKAFIKELEADLERTRQLVRELTDTKRTLYQRVCDLETKLLRVALGRMQVESKEHDVRKDMLPRHGAVIRFEHKFEHQPNFEYTYVATFLETRNGGFWYLTSYGGSASDANKRMTHDELIDFVGERPIEVLDNKIIAGPRGMHRMYYGNKIGGPHRAEYPYRATNWRWS